MILAKSLCSRGGFIYQKRRKSKDEQGQYCLEERPPVCARREYVYIAGEAMSSL